MSLITYACYRCGKKRLCHLVDGVKVCYECVPPQAPPAEPVPTPLIPSAPETKRSPSEEYASAYEFHPPRIIGVDQGKLVLSDDYWKVIDRACFEAAYDKARELMMESSGFYSRVKP